MARAQAARSTEFDSSESDAICGQVEFKDSSIKAIQLSVTK